MKQSVTGAKGTAMPNSCREQPCGIRNVCQELRKIGCAADPSWMAILLFARNLLREFSIFSDTQKKAVQQLVFAEFSKRDSSEQHFKSLVADVETFLAENSRMVALREQLASEQEAARSLVLSVNRFLRESLASEQERGKLVRRFGGEIMAALDGGEPPDVLLPRLRDLVTEMLAHYREEALAWERKALLLEKIVRFDPLLAPLHNRRALDEYLETAVADAEAGSKSLSVLMIDVDNFKAAINDVYGHAVGDDVLRALAKIVEAHAGRFNWFAARYGGDELALVCDIDGGEAAFHGDALRLAVQRYEFVPRINGRLAETPLRFTVSIGVASFVPGMTGEALLAAADTAMYRVKQGGRNNVARYRPPAGS